MNEDLYEILQVSPNADPEVIEAAYRRLARKFHPDLNPGSAAALEQMKRLNTAYAVLRDPAKRSSYDGKRAPEKVPIVRTPSKSGNRPSPPPSQPSVSRSRVRPKSILRPTPEDFQLTNSDVKAIKFVNETFPLVFPLVCLSIIAIYGIHSVYSRAENWYSLVGGLIFIPIIYMIFHATWILILTGIFSLILERVYLIKRSISSDQYKRYKDAVESHQRKIRDELTQYWESLTSHEFISQLIELFESCGHSILYESVISDNSGYFTAVYRDTKLVILYLAKRDNKYFEDSNILHKLISSEEANLGVIVSRCNTIGDIPYETRRYVKKHPIHLLRQWHIVKIDQMVVDGEITEARAYIMSGEMMRC